jgi:hypothetical protein
MMNPWKDLALGNSAATRYELPVNRMIVYVMFHAGSDQARAIAPDSRLIYPCAVDGLFRLDCLDALSAML